LQGVLFHVFRVLFALLVVGFLHVASAVEQYTHEASRIVPIHNGRTILATLQFLHFYLKDLDEIIAVDPKETSEDIIK
jgi:hypothetical protein